MSAKGLPGLLARVVGEQVRHGEGCVNVGRVQLSGRQDETKEQMVEKTSMCYPYKL